MEKSIGYGSAPGKVIISGDHSVVYGYPALATALSLRCYVTAIRGERGLKITADGLEGYSYNTDELKSIKLGQKFSIFDNLAILVMKLISDEIALNLEIRSEIPISAGLGSSAAVAVATVAAITDLYQLNFTKEEISSYAYESEKVVHGKSSGIDNSIATWGGLLVFKEGNIEIKELKHKIPLMIINSNIPRNTKKLVLGVSERRDRHDKIMNAILLSMGILTSQVISEVDNGDLVKLGELMNMNQGLLEAIGVSHPLISQLTWDLNKMGALGSKLTGAGGGGCMIALFNSLKDTESIRTKLIKTGVEVIITEASPVGVVIGR